MTVSITSLAPETILDILSFLPRSSLRNTLLIRPFACYSQYLLVVYPTFRTFKSLDAFPHFLEQDENDELQFHFNERQSRCHWKDLVRNVKCDMREPFDNRAGLSKRLASLLINCRKLRTLQIFEGHKVDIKATLFLAQEKARPRSTLDLIMARLSEPFRREESEGFPLEKLEVLGTSFASASKYVKKRRTFFGFSLSRSVDLTFPALRTIKLHEVRLPYSPHGNLLGNLFSSAPHLTSLYLSDLEISPEDLVSSFTYLVHPHLLSKLHLSLSSHQSHLSSILLLLPHLQHLILASPLSSAALYSLPPNLEILTLSVFLWNSFKLEEILLRILLEQKSLREVRIESPRVAGKVHPVWNWVDDARLTKRGITVRVQDEEWEKEEMKWLRKKIGPRSQRRGAICPMPESE